eukprot:gnl/Chilomastix_cuspidata/766.p1 GENE.gnl/Chilomastix_cuspidata/766~~gnl/Chilomastix_cuspidata/766.p1  ORF type:complete len:1443 (+),score=563.17 gnl/Chilomastix_cuspidata/766:34-4362(+)
MDRRELLEAASRNSPSASSKRIRSVKFYRNKPRWRQFDIHLIIVLVLASVAYSVHCLAESEKLFALVPKAEKVLRVPQHVLDDYREYGLPPPKPPRPIHINFIIHHEAFHQFHLSLFFLLVPMILGTVDVVLRFWVLKLRIRLSLLECPARQATSVLITPTFGNGKPCLADMEHRARCVSQDEAHNADFVTEQCFFWQARKFVLTEGNTFEKLPFPTRVPLEECYAAPRGLTARQHFLAQALFGKNALEVPSPTFRKLMKEHLMAPFFVFQVFCCILWMIDDFALYSGVNLLIIVGMEAMTVLQRIGAMREIKGMTPRNSKVEVFRDGKWTLENTDNLVPGDILAISANTADANRAYGIEKAQGRAAPKKRLNPFILIAANLGIASALVPEKPPAPPQFTNAAPADMILLAGGAVIDEATLTGESTPQIKEPLCERTEFEADPKQPFGFQTHRTSVVFAGTTFVSTAPLTGSSHRVKLPDGFEAIPLPPSKGALFFCVRTGFESSQGKLIRGFAFDRERLSANTKESLFFMLILMVFAVAGSLYTYVRGSAANVCPKPRLVLKCLLIFVSVIPPELPIELSLIVSTSMRLLKRRLVYCTEPFRIPLAGALRVCCFDKTGTLTEERMDVLGIVNKPHGAAGDHRVKKGSTQKPDARLMNADFLTCLDPNVANIIGACHSLVLEEVSVPGKSAKFRVCGDQLEAAAFRDASWHLNVRKGTGETSCTTRYNGGKRTISVLRRFPFSSTLKRMSVIGSLSDLSGQGANGTFVFAKGAPEVMFSHFAAETVPEWFGAELQRISSLGLRVLALGFKPLAPRALSSSAPLLKTVSRASAEENLIFAGFLVADSPLKKDTLETVRILRGSAHRLVMVTGDNLLTAVAVGARAEIIPRAAPTREPEGPAGGPARTVVLSRLRELDDGELSASFLPLETVASNMLPGALGEASAEHCAEVSTRQTVDEVQRFGREFVVCASGAELQQLLLDEKWRRLALLLAPTLRILARTNPEAKASFVRLLEENGLPALMCGDGTNDVGALRAASVGVALFETPDYKLAKEQRARDKELGIKERSFMGIDLPNPAAQRARQQSAMSRRGPGGPANTTWRPSVLGPNERPASQAQLLEAARQRCAANGTKLYEELRALTQEQVRWRRILAGQPDPGANATNGAIGLSAGSLSPALLELLASTDDDDDKPKIGDASIAAPFTSKSGTTKGVLKIIRQGRCTLVSTLSSYKTIGLQCIIAAYSLSALTLDGVRSSDSQMVVLSMMMSSLMITISNAKPVKEISARPAPSRVLGRYCLGSLFGQLAVHFVVLPTVVRLVHDAARETLPFETKFTPSMMNTVVFFADSCMQITAMAVNYAGAPFMQSVRKYKALRNSIIGSYGVLFALVLQVLPDINRQLGFLIMPRALMAKVAALLVFDVLGSFGVEALCKRLLAPRPLDTRDV